MRSFLPFLLFLFCLGYPAATFATEGATEINQASVEAGGGFPLVISTSGNYVLTSDLIVPANTQAILLLASNVFIDLRGFHILGPHACSVGGCQTGTVDGISGHEGSGRRITVTGGTVSGFSGTCVELLGESYVSEMFVSKCGLIGVQVSQGSLVRTTRVSDTGRQGIVLLGDIAGYSENVAYLTGLAVGSVGPESVGIDGGTALGQNVCLRGSCALGRRYYLTEGEFAGNQAAAASTCGQGFHMASLFELWDTSGLRYDNQRGVTMGDSGEGPPTDIRGWVRTGRFSNNAPQGPGRNNCSVWSTTSGSGTRVGLNFVWEDPASAFGPFRVDLGSCATPEHVWCVEDWN